MLIVLSLYLSIYLSASIIDLSATAGGAKAARVFFPDAVDTAAISTSASSSSSLGADDGTGHAASAAADVVDGEDPAARTQRIEAAAAAAAESAYLASLHCPELECVTPSEVPRGVK